MWKVIYFPNNSLIDLNMFKVLSSFGSQYPVPTIISTEVAPVSVV